MVHKLAVRGLERNQSNNILLSFVQGRVDLNAAISGYVDSGSAVVFPWRFTLLPVLSLREGGFLFGITM
jgi:hypothetical protein